MNTEPKGDNGPFAGIRRTARRLLRSFRAVSIYGIAALHEEQERGSRERAEQLERKQNKDGAMPDYLKLTAEEEQEEQTMQAMIKAAAAFNAGQPPLMPPGSLPAYMQDVILITGLEEWSGSRKTWRAKRALLDGANINAQDEHGMTALHYAVKSGEPAVVKLLLQAGANVLARARSGETPVDIARSEGKDSLLALMLEHMLAYRPTEF
jgi:hypothetical protein